MLSVIIPAHDEAAYIAPCLQALLAADPPRTGMEVLVVANGCSDNTAEVARNALRAAPCPSQVIELTEGGKPGALNRGDAAAQGNMRLYLDADVVITPTLLVEIETLLARAEPAYASGRVTIPTPDSWASRRFQAFYQTVPFIAEGVPGCGLFAVNAAGRALWSHFPQIIADDTYVRLQFRPDQRHLAAAHYDWPLVEGFANLVKVRRRQDQGVNEIAARYPELLRNDDKRSYPKPRLLANIARMPISFLVYMAVKLAGRLAPGPQGWSRGR